MLALLAYPFLLEPAIGTRQQTWLWTAGYVVLVALTAACAMSVRACGERRSPRDSTAAPVVKPSLSRCRRRLRWVILSFVPSSLMLGVTTHISTDIAAVPLLWVLPLAMYLATFVLAFSAQRSAAASLAVRLLPVLSSDALHDPRQRRHVVADSAAPRHVLRLRDGLPSRAGASPTRCRAPDRVLHLDVVRRDARRRVQRPGRSAGVLHDSGIPTCSRAGGAGAPSTAFRRSRPEPIGPLLGLPAFVLLLVLRTVGGRLDRDSFGTSGAPAGVRRSCSRPSSLFVNRPGAFGAMSLVCVGVIAVGLPSEAGTVLFAPAASSAFIG